MAWLTCIEEGESFRKSAGSHQTSSSSVTNMLYNNMLWIWRASEYFLLHSSPVSVSSSYLLEFPCQIVLVSSLFPFLFFFWSLCYPFASSLFGFCFSGAKTDSQQFFSVGAESGKSRARTRGGVTPAGQAAWNIVRWRSDKSWKMTTTYGCSRQHETGIRKYSRTRQ